MNTIDGKPIILTREWLDGYGKFWNRPYFEDALQAIVRMVATGVMPEAEALERIKDIIDGELQNQEWEFSEMEGL